MEETIPDGGIPGAAVFKKPSGKRRGTKYRRPRLSGEDEEEEEEKDRVLLSVVESKFNLKQEWTPPIHKGEAKHLQDLLEDKRSRAKGRRKGMDSSALLKGPNREAEEQHTIGLKASNKDGLLDEDGGGESAELPGTATKSLMVIMDSQFKSGGEALGRPQSVPHQDIMEAYIKAELEKSEGKSISAKKVSDVLLTEEEQLYVIPEDVRKNVEEAKRHYGTNADADDDTGGAQLAWNTGIAEVELPDSANARTIELTHEAVKHMRKCGNRFVRHIPGSSALKNVSNTKSIRSSAAPTNIASNFNLHQKEYILRTRENSQRNKADEGEKITVGETRSDWKYKKHHVMSNDDAAVARHIKRMRR